MQTLRVNIKSTDIDNARKITNMLYELVDKEKIESVKISEIKKGKNSIDINPIIQLIGNIDIVAAFESGIISAAAGTGGAYYGLKLAREIISIVRDGIRAYEKLNKKSFMGLHCKIGRHTLTKFGRSYGVQLFDTILVSATPQSIDDTLLAKKQWGEIPISKDKYALIDYVAIFVKSPIAAIEWIGKVKDIKYNPVNKKSTILFTSINKIKPIPYDDRWPHHNAHGTVYTTMERIKHAETLSDVYPSLDKQRKKE